VVAPYKSYISIGKIYHLVKPTQIAHLCMMITVTGALVLATTVNSVYFLIIRSCLFIGSKKH
jgi:hypothetical protein